MRFFLLLLAAVLAVPLCSGRVIADDSQFGENFTFAVDDQFTDSDDGQLEVMPIRRYTYRYPRYYGYPRYYSYRTYRPYSYYDYYPNYYAPPYYYSGRYYYGSPYYYRYRPYYRYPYGGYYYQTPGLGLRFGF